MRPVLSSLAILPELRAPGNNPTDPKEEAETDRERSRLIHFTHTSLYNYLTALRPSDIDSIIFFSESSRV